MKKLIAFFCVAVIGLSLVACGGKNYIEDEEFLSYVELTELTVDNCMEYLTIEEVVDVDSFGDATGYKYIGVKLKDGYGTLDETVIKLKYTATPSYDKKGEVREEECELYDCVNWCHLQTTSEKNEDWSVAVTDIQVTNVKGTVFKVNIPDEIWKINEQGERYFVTGTDENIYTIDERKDNPSRIWARYARAIEEALAREALKSAK